MTRYWLHAKLALQERKIIIPFIIINCFIDPMLSIKLQTLLAVANLHNFIEAAQMLSLTQPTVSHHISPPEQEFLQKLTKTYRETVEAYR